MIGGTFGRGIGIPLPSCPLSCPFIPFVNFFLDIDDGLQTVDQCKDLIDEEIEYINQDRNDKELNITKESKESKYVVNTSKIYETNNSGSCQNSFTPVSRGAKPAKCNESNVYFNVSNRFTILEIEPCMESFDVKM